MEIPNLDHQRDQSGVASLGVDLPSFDAYCLLVGDGKPLAIRTSCPAAPRKCDQRLTFTGLARADLSARVDSEQVVTCLRITVGQVHSAGRVGVEEGYCIAFGGGIEGLHRGVASPLS